MRAAIVHLSDIHYRPNWQENHGVLFRAFFKDLREQLKPLGDIDVYLVLSGDIVQAGHDMASYQNLNSLFEDALEDLNIPKSHRISVPGNHDVSIKKIESNIVDHEGAVSLNLDETQFNDYSEKPINVFKSKFSNYSAFESLFSETPTIGTPPTGSGTEINKDIGIFCLNSAFFSSGGLKDSNSKKLDDKGRLSVNTRNLHSWVSSCKASCKILVMHHPLFWLTPWAQKEIRTLLNNDFALSLSGHTHNQSVFHFINKERSIVEISAPPLFTKKSDLLGYSIVYLSSEYEVSEIIYRQWTKQYSFVSGVNFANSDEGKVIIKVPNKYSSLSEPHVKGVKDVVLDYLSYRLNEALTSFSSQPKVWVDPILSNKSELDQDSDTENRVAISDIINNPHSILIKAPPQFGLTCLAHHLAIEAWRHAPGSLWLYLDARLLKPSSNKIKRGALAELQRIGLSLEDVKCVILDSWYLQDKNAIRLLKSLCKFFKDIPIVVMQTTSNSLLLSPGIEEEINREFDVLFLWALSRENIRAVVSSYNDQRHIGDEDAVISRVVSDIDVLNIHRTPLNCLTILKASEVDFDESPVNRTEMLKRVLFLLFNVDEIPTYRTRPDMKDCEFVIGYFCEKLMRTNTYSFTREYFIETLEDFCKKRVIALDVHIVFDILYNNHILIPFLGQFCFRFTYWVYYFVAQRMHHDKEFAEFMFMDMQYARFPEVIEFYTGIDRRREDALKILIDDLNRGNETMRNKCGIPVEFNPYKYIQHRFSR